MLIDEDILLDLPDQSGGNDRWNIFISLDTGFTRPTVCGLIAESPGATHEGRFYPRGTKIVVDEVATYAGADRINEGLQWPVSKLAEGIIEMCNRWGAKPVGVADDACFAQHGHQVGSLAKEFRKYGVYLRPAKKGSRVWGWQLMKQLLVDAGTDKPGLYICRNCEYFWLTAPTIPRDPRKPDDVDSRAADHAIDMVRYACTATEKSVLHEVRLLGI